MIQIGSWELGKKVTGFRSDFCRGCERPVVALQRRKWVWFHVFFVPVVPFMIRHRWLCPSCDERTAARPRTSLAAKYAWLCFAVLVILCPFLDPDDPSAPGEEGAPAAVFWVLGSVGAIYCLAKIIRHRPIPSRRSVLATFEPATIVDCPVCGSRVERDEGIEAWQVSQCTGCGLKDKPLKLDR